MLLCYGTAPDGLSEIAAELGLELVAEARCDADPNPVARVVVFAACPLRHRAALRRVVERSAGPVLTWIASAEQARASVAAGADGFLRDGGEPWEHSATIALAMARATRSIVDRCTGLPTWKAVRAQVGRDLALARRFERSSALLVVILEEGASDPDRLRRLAEGLQRSVRDTDLVARYDAGEFVVLAAEAEYSEARILGRRILEDAGAGISVGLACSKAVDVAGPDDLLRQAMTAAERARLAGGSRLETSVDE